MKNFKGKKTLILFLTLRFQWLKMIFVCFYFIYLGVE